MTRLLIPHYGTPAQKVPSNGPCGGGLARRRQAVQTFLKASSAPK